MTHIRQQIRDAVATAVTGLASGAEVVKSQVFPLPETTVLAILVDTGDEETEYITMDSPRTVEAVLDVEIQVMVRNATAPEDSRDDVLAEIQAALSASTLGGILKGPISLVSTETAEEPEAETRIFGAVMTWAAEYHFKENDPETAV